MPAAIDPTKYGLKLIDPFIEWDRSAHVITVRGKLPVANASGQVNAQAEDRAYTIRYFLVTQDKDKPPQGWVQWKGLHSMCVQVMEYKGGPLPSIMTDESVPISHMQSGGGK